MKAAFPKAVPARTKALFVDLAGVLLDPVAAPGRQPGLRSGTGAALRLLDRLDYRLIGLAPCTLDRRRASHIGQARAADLLARERVDLAGFYGCDAQDASGPACANCPPSPAMLLRAAQENGIALEASWLLTQRTCHHAAARLAGCGTIIIGAGDGDRHWLEQRQLETIGGPPVYRSRDIIDAALAIARLEEEQHACAR